MQKQAPTFGRMMVMVGFALSCFALLLFLWLAFGGSVPLKPKGYRFTTSFSEGTQLAVEADVRISGVPVGKVKTIDAKDTGRSEVVVEMDAKFAPIPKNTRAVLRQKTLLGETFVELTPGDPKRGMLPEAGTLPPAQVSDTTELDEIFQTFDPKTRVAFQDWLQNQAIALDGRGRDISDTIGNLAPFARDTQQLLAILKAQDADVRGVVRDTGTVFDALSSSESDLRGIIQNSNRVFAATARQSDALQETFRVLPTFEDESKKTIDRLDAFARNADPLVTQLRPAARELSPTLRQLQLLAPDLKSVLRDLDPLITASEKGLPATRRFLEDLRPFLGELDGPLRQLNPMIEYLDRYKREIGAFVANAAAATQATSSTANGGQVHYLRVNNPLNPEGLAVYPRRIGTNRANPYQLPGTGDRLNRGGLQVFDSRGCNNGTPKLFDPKTATAEELALVSPDFRESIKRFGLANRERPTSANDAPDCVQQPKARTNVGSAQYPQLGAAMSGRTLTAGPPSGPSLRTKKK